MSLASVAAPLLACAGLHCVSLGLARARLTPPQLECLLGSCERGRCGCREAEEAGEAGEALSLNISNNDLASLPQDSLAQALPRLLRLNVGRSEHSSNPLHLLQKECFLGAFAEATT